MAAAAAAAAAGGGGASCHSVDASGGNSGGGEVKEGEKGVVGTPPAAPRPSRRLLVASTSIDLIDLSDDSGSDQSRYSSFNPGYKSTTPPDDVSMQYPTTSVTVYEEPNLPVLHEIFEGPTASHIAQLVSGATSAVPSTSFVSLEELVQSGLWRDNNSPAPRASWAGPSGNSPPPLPPRPRSTTPNIQYMESPPRSPRSPRSADSSPRSPCPSDDSCQLPSFVDVRPRSLSSSHSGRSMCAPEDRPLPPPPPTDRPLSPLYWELERPSSSSTRSRFRQHLHAPIPMYSHHAEQILRQAKLRRERQAARSSQPASSPDSEADIKLRHHNHHRSSPDVEADVKLRHHNHHRSSPDAEADVKPRHHNHHRHGSKVSLALKKEGYPQVSSQPHLAKWGTHSEVWVPQVKHSHSVPCHVKEAVGLTDLPATSNGSKSKHREKVDKSEEARSQSCEALPGSHSLRKDTRRNKRRCPTPPRVLSPSLDQIQCHVVADI